MKGRAAGEVRLNGAVHVPSRTARREGRDKWPQQRLRQLLGKALGLLDERDEDGHDGRGQVPAVVLIHHAGELPHVVDQQLVGLEIEQEQAAFDLRERRQAPEGHGEGAAAGGGREARVGAGGRGGDENGRQAAGTHPARSCKSVCSDRRMSAKTSRSWESEKGDSGAWTFKTYARQDAR